VPTTQELAQARAFSLSEIDSSEFMGLYISIVAVVGCLFYLTSFIQGMEHMDMHENYVLVCLTHV